MQRDREKERDREKVETEKAYTHPLGKAKACPVSFIQWYSVLRWKTVGLLNNRAALGCAVLRRGPLLSAGDALGPSHSRQ